MTVLKTASNFGYPDFAETLTLAKAHAQRFSTRAKPTHRFHVGKDRAMLNTHVVADASF